MWFFIAWVSVDWAAAQEVVRGPQPDVDAPVTVSATSATRWAYGQYDVWHLRGQAVIEQGEIVARANEAVLWIDAGDPYIREPHRVIAYLEGSVEVDHFRVGDPHRETGRSAQTIVGEQWLGRFVSVSGIQLNVMAEDVTADQAPEIHERGLQYRRQSMDDSVIPAQFALSPSPQDTQGVLPAPVEPITDVDFTGRGSNADFFIKSYYDEAAGEQVTIADRGVRVTIRSSQFAELLPDGTINEGQSDLETIVILADRMVGWSSRLRDLVSGDIPEDQQRWEIYLEGNIVFSFAERVIYADRMYYDVNTKTGTILNAEMLTPVPEYDGLVRLKTDVLRQLNEQEFEAFNAAFTTSRLGYPRYWLQAGNVRVRHEQIPLVDPFTGGPAEDLATGRPLFDHEYRAQSNNNFIYAGGFPVFYWPTFATDLTDPVYYIESFSLKNDDIFGTQVLTEWNLYQLLGIRNPIDNSNWTLDADYLSRRGFGLGTQFDYQTAGTLGGSAMHTGKWDAWGIRDRGLDNLGLDRRQLVPEEDFRGRVWGQHRTRWDVGYELTAEVGLISDRNFLEQYYELEWDQYKDQTTGLAFKSLADRQSFGILGNVRLNPFFAETEWLPRGDHFLLGQPLLLDRVTWNAHTHAGYGRLRVADAPLNPADLAKFRTLPWEAERRGLRAGTRHSVDIPFSAGPVRVVPFLLGDITYWESDLNDQSVTRLTGQAGVRANLPFWKSDPTVQSTLFNLNGLAHKVDLEIESSWADSSEDVGRFPLYDPLDDNAQEQFRRRFAFDNFGGPVVPLPFDERNFAFRRGMQGYVTSPTAEVADDYFATRLGVNQRWQTKRGFPGQQRIVDYVSLDVSGTLFSRPARDNFGETLGLLDYDFSWNVGDRFSIVSDGYFDFFTSGLQTASIGVSSSRPELGTAYLGYRTIEGPITSRILSGALSYRMSEKWIATAGTAVDFGPTGNIGQTLTFTRIGESLILRFGLRADASRGNVGAIVSLEPRFLPRDRQGRIDGIYVPPPGSRGPE